MSVADLLTTPPPDDAGIEVGVTDWRFIVELALPHDASSTWGVGTWGSMTWGGLQWLDVTDKVRGVEWFRGADEPYGRPRIGELLVTIDARTMLSPLDSESAYYAPGTLIRVSVLSPSETNVNLKWLPQFTGVIDSWPLTTVARGADQIVEVRAYETLRFLSEIDETALSSVVGFDDWPDVRIQRLLDASDWPYGPVQVDVEALRYQPDIDGNFWALQSTDMALNRLAECYLVADCCAADFRSGRDGRPVLVAPWWFGYVDGADPAIWPLMEHSYLSDRPYLGFGPTTSRVSGADFDFLYVGFDDGSIVVSNEDAYIVNSAMAARIGGTAQQREQPASIARYGRRTSQRFDLPVRYDTTAEFVAWRTAARQSLNTLRIDELTISTVDRGEDTFITTVAADIGAITVTYPTTGPVQITGWLRNMTHRITPRGPHGVTWTTTLSMDTIRVYSLPAAQLPREDFS